ncbi:hypothetical protein [Streptomyces sp. BA2]|nr:hypothetical protein [Streptomyces sp. BA2]MWA08834.1 hypothetical protein [Streptomyces sp. BA2]
MKAAPRTTLAERVAGRGRLATKVRDIEERIKQRRDDSYDDQPTPERRKP